MGNTAQARASYRSALRSGDLRRLLGTQLISSSGSWAYNVALMVYLYDRTHSASWVAAGALGRFLPTLACSGYAGVIAERYEQVRLMVRLNLLALVLQLALALAVWRAAPAAVAIVLAGLTSVVLSPYNPAVAALIPQVVREGQLAAANALNATIDNLVVVAGPAVGALLLLLGGPPLAIAVNAATFGLAALWLPAMKVRSQPSDVSDGGRAGPVRPVLDGFRSLAASAAVATFVAFSVVASFVYGTDTVLFIPIARDQLHSGTSGYGYLLAGLGVGGILGAAVVNRLAARTRLAAAILGGMGVFCLPTALLVVVHQPVIGFALQVVRGAGTLVVDTLAIALRAAIAGLSSLGARAAVAVVARELRSLGERHVPREPRPATSAHPAGLTAREVEVLRLLAGGMRNAEIAARLVVSPRTVDHHVSAVLRKLNARTRSEAITAALRLGLVQA